ncbi:MAG: peptidoglycan DD-metalloendopeptidase family protein [Bacteroidales bacterium]|jgi:murein DD-endopeptidase MepM/ murein hydrolase activator NlpD|nr:peptidoglycan DD-metalloendopeptidase family protein [Bacteroidales bacterium]
MKLRITNYELHAGWLVVMLLLAACKSLRPTVTEPSYRMAEKPQTAELTAKNEMPAVPKASKPSTAVKPEATATNRASAYPAMEYYGDSWNTEHVRLNASAMPTGTTTLNVGNDPFVMPACGKVNSEFGPRGRSMHTGIDIKVEMDEPVYCAFAGMVRMAKVYGAYGKVVVVRHSNGLETTYSHLNSIAVSVNQRLNAGDLIGGGGRTGNASGVHLHFETRFKGEPFNPRLLIDFENCRIQSPTLVLGENSYKLFGKTMTAGVQPAKTAQTAPVGTSAAPPAVHTVQQGDTLYSLARRYGTTVDALRKLNGLNGNSILKIGQKLKLR